MKKLVRVAKTPTLTTMVVNENGAPINRTGEIDVLSPTAIAHNVYEHGFRMGEFFLAEDREVDALVARLAEMNPGKEVQVYELTSVAECPAAPLVRKSVTKDGILPL